MPNIPDADRTPINRRPPPPVADVTKNLADPHSVLYILADATGGFVILNTNDIVGGMQKITQEQSSYYMLGFVPTPAAEGSCHRLKVKVSRPGVEVRSRNTYCTVKPIDYLAGDPAEQQLEAQLETAKADNAAVTMTAPFFYTAANTARVNLILDIPSVAMAPDASGGKFHREYNVLGIAYKADGSVAARFSDTIKLDLDKKEFEAFRAKPYHYEKQFPIASGDYTLKVALASGANVVARADAPLKVDLYDSKRLSLSSVTLTKDLIDVTHNQELLDRAMVEDRTLLIFDGMEFVPSAMKRFKRTDTALMYMEVYEPMLVDNPAGVSGVNLRYRVLSLDTGATVMDTGVFAPKAAVRPGYPVVPVALRLLSDRLQPGSYRLVVQASNAGGEHSPERNVDFDVE